MIALEMKTALNFIAGPYSNSRAFTETLCRAKRADQCRRGGSQGQPDSNIATPVVAWGGSSLWIPEARCPRRSDPSNIIIMKTRTSRSRQCSFLPCQWQCPSDLAGQ